MDNTCLLYIYIVIELLILFWVTVAFTNPKAEILIWRSQNQRRRITADDADFTDGQNPLTLRNRN